MTALLTRLPWTHNLITLTQSKRPEEREFYLRLAVQEKCTSRELERQCSLGTFERAVLNPAKVSAALAQMHGAAAGSVFKDAKEVPARILKEARTTRHYSLCGPTMGQPGQIGPIINVCALARVMATRRIFLLR